MRESCTCYKAQCKTNGLSNINVDKKVVMDKKKGGGDERTDLASPKQE